MKSETEILIDLGAECAVLGAIFLEPDTVISYVLDKKLTPEAFYDSRNSILFRTMMNMSSQARPIDTMTVLRRLEDKGNIIKAGGRDYVLSLLGAIPTWTYVEYYLDIVIEKNRLRCLAACVNVVPTMIEEGSSSSEIVSQVITDIVANVDLGQKENPIQLHAQSIDEFERAKVGYYPGLTSFLAPINEVIGSYVDSNVYVVAGRPSDGKSCYGYNEVIFQAVGKGIPCAFASLEMSAKLLREMMAGAIANVSMYQMRRGLYTPYQMERLKNAFDLLQKAPIFINDSRMTIEETIAWLTYMVRKHKVRFFVLDYLQLLRPSKHQRAGASRNEEVQEWSACIKDVTKRLKIITLLISQVSRIGNRLQDKTPLPLTLETLRDSGAIEQDADAVIMFYKKPNVEYSTFFTDADWEMEVSIEKHRIGPTGIRPYVFVRRRQRIEDISIYAERKNQENDPLWTRSLFPKEETANET